LKDERAAAASTEGMYWKYESFLKKEDARLSSLIGAAGELFSIRTSLFEPIPNDTILDDFIISMNILRKGYRIAYAPKALAMEKPSKNIEEEYKRKVRISAGGIQATIRTTEFFNVKKYGVVALQYMIHRISRWTISPILLVLALTASFFTLKSGIAYQIIFALQILFYTAALLGWAYKENKKESRLLNIPFYFLFMHYCVVMGWVRYFKGNQNAAWQKAARLHYN
jgi:cellulose synthase/poly-beta-1,6-N-acetylglucosamine synthase-like glycosyltransferase